MSDQTFRPRRSVLYMPSSNERALEKAKTLPVDALILDLEDAVAPDAKPQARLNAAAAVTSGEYGAKELTIRINGADTRWHADDLKAAVIEGSGLTDLDMSCFDGRYVTGTVTPEYLAWVEQSQSS